MSSYKKGPDRHSNYPIPAATSRELPSTFHIPSSLRSPSTTPSHDAHLLHLLPSAAPRSTHLPLLQHMATTSLTRGGRPIPPLADEAVPRDDSDAQDPSDAAKDERDDAPRREARGQRRGRRGLAREVEEVGRVARGVAGGRDGRRVGRARGVVVGGYGECLLQVERRLDEGR